MGATDPIAQKASGRFIPCLIKKKLFPLGHLPWGKLLFLRIGERLLTHSLERGIVMSDNMFFMIGNTIFVVCCIMAIAPLFFYNKKK